MKASRAALWCTIPLIGLLGMALVVVPTVSSGQMPGDLGDARFNNYILEHFYRWITGSDDSFWTAPFFYPFPLTIAFSDNYLGNGLPYALLRAFGFDREDAFRLWFVLGFVLNFVAAAYALRRLGYGRLATALGAFLFAFGLPITTQEGHSQLIYRFGVPLAVLALAEFDRHRQLRQLVLAAFWTVWQFYCSLYIGYFLVLLLAALELSTVLMEWRFSRDGMLSRWHAIVEHWNARGVRGYAAFLLAMAILAALMVPLCWPYVEVTRLYGFRRTWFEIASMLPRLQSYILSNNSRLWPSTGAVFAALPMRHEQAMFVGLAPVLAIAAALVVRARKLAAPDPLFRAAALAILLIALLTLWYRGHSLYYVVAELPGVNSIRAITRIGIVLLFPVAILLASAIDAILDASRISSVPRFALVWCIAGLLVFESAFVTHHTSDKRDWQDRIAHLASALPATLPAAPILLLAPSRGEPAFLWQLDAMVLAQERGWRTINGYSGNEPPGYSLAGRCEDVARNLSLGLAMFGEPTEQEFQDLARQVLAIGYPTCSASTLVQRPRITLFTGPLPVDTMRHTVVRIDRLALRDGMVVVDAVVTNGDATVIPAGSRSGTPVRFSARYIDAGISTSSVLGGAGWDMRQDLALDISPGETQRVEILMAPPTTPGRYKVALSMVQDGVAWFHDKGMVIPLSTQIVVMDQTVHLADGSP